MSDTLLEKRGDGAFVTFNRPEARNPLNPEMLSAVTTFLDSVDADPEVRYIVFQGAGGNFSAGGDLSIYAQTLESGPAERRVFFENRHRGNGACFLRLEAFSKPIISVVRGAAAGAGLSFLLASDYVLAAEDAKLVFAQPRVGLPLDLSLTYHLPRVVGPKVARQLGYSGATLDANRARQIGIIDEVHPADQLEEALAVLVKPFSAVSLRAAAHSKWLVDSSQRFSLTEQLEREAQTIGACVNEPDFREGVNAFLEKRRAVFTGRTR